MKFLQKEQIIHFSHFHRYVSAYHTTEEMLEDLERMLRDALVEAKKSGSRQIVEQDCLEYFFVVYQSGTIALCREIASFEVLDEDMLRRCSKHRLTLWDQDASCPLCQIKEREE